MTVCGYLLSKAQLRVDISPEELIASLGDSTSFGSLKKLLKEVDELEGVNVC
jgi:hypothetical protein